MKARDEFPIKNKKTGLRSVWCRPCRRAYGREHYYRDPEPYRARARERRRREIPRIRAAIDEYVRSHPCVDCGETDATVLDFDHRDRAEKVDVVSRLARGTSMRAVIAEMDKCDVRCAKCHRRKTAGDFRWSKLLGVVIDPNDVRPGQAGRYARPQAAIQGLLLSTQAHGLRRCSRCRELKALTDFAFRDLDSGVRGHYCRPCQAAYRRAHYEANRSDYMARAMKEMHLHREDQLLRVHDYLRGHPCVDCGETDIVVLEFDHIDPRTKTKPVSYLIGRRNWATVLAELAKCEVRCVNCHRRRTAKQQGWRQRLGETRGRYRRSARMRLSRE